MQDTARIISRQRIYQVFAGDQRVLYFVRKLLRENSFQPLAKFLAGEFAGLTLEILADKLQAVGLQPAKAFDGQRQALVGVVGDGEYAPGKVVAFRPDVQQRLFPGTADLPGEPSRGATRPPFSGYFHQAVGGELLEPGFELGGEFHALEYNQDYYYSIVIL